jgi:hypothetical protein
VHICFVTGMLRRGGSRVSDQSRDRKDAHHAASPALKGRTFTTFIMPACI